MVMGADGHCRTFLNCNILLGIGTCYFGFVMMINPFWICRRGHVYPKEQCDEGRKCKATVIFTVGAFGDGELSKRCGWKQVPLTRETAGRTRKL